MIKPTTQSKAPSKVSKTKTPKTTSKKETPNLFEPAKTTKTTKNTKSSTANPKITEEKAEEYAAKIYKAMKGIGTDEKTIKNILTDKKFNSGDIALIAQKFAIQGDLNSRRYLGDAIKKEFSGSDQKQLLKILADALIDVAVSGDHSGSWQAMHMIKNDKPIAKMFITTDKDDLNIHTSTMVAGIRG